MTRQWDEFRDKELTEMVERDDQVELRLPPKRYCEWDNQDGYRHALVMQGNEPRLIVFIGGQSLNADDPRIALTMIVRAWENEVKRMAEKRWRGVDLKPTITSQQKDKIFDAYGKLCDRHEDAEAQFKGWDALLKALELEGGQ